MLGPVDDAEEAADRCRDGSVDLAIVDLDRADERGLEVVGPPRDACDGARVLVMTDREGADVVAGALGAGACVFREVHGRQRRGADLPPRDRR